MKKTKKFSELEVNDTIKINNNEFTITKVSRDEKDKGIVNIVFNNETTEDIWMSAHEKQTVII